MTQPTPEEVEKYVEGAYSLVADYYDGQIEVDELRKQMAELFTTYGHNRYQQGVKDTLAGVPEEKELKECGKCNACESVMTCTTMEANYAHNTCRAAVIKHGEELLEGK